MAIGENIVMNIAYAVALVISASICTIVAAVIYYRRTAPGASGLLFYMIACIIWAGTYAVRWTTSEIGDQLFWLDATYFGVVQLTTTFLIFTLQFTDRSHVVNRRNLVLLSIVPIFTLIILWTDKWHGLFFGGIPRTTGSIFNGGPAFWLFVVYAYGLMFIAIGLLVQALWRTSGLYRSQTAAVMFAACLPVAGNIISLAGFSPFPDLDLTPFIFACSGLIYAYALIGFRMMDVVPIARHKLVDEMTDGIIVLDASKRIVDVNPAARRLIGISDSVIGKAYDDFLKTRLHFDPVHDPGVPSLTELRISEDPLCDIELQTLPLFDKNLKISGHLLILHDITERKQVIEELHESGELLREVGHVAKVGGWNLDLAVNKLTWTEETYLIHEVEQNLKPQLNEGINFYAPDARPVLQAAVDRAIAQGTPYDLELPFITAKGNHLWVRTIGNADIVDGRVVRLYGIFQDITESKRAEDALRDKEEQYRAIAESSSDYIMRYDRNFRHIFANQIAIKLTGLPVDQYIGKNHREMGYPDDLCELWEEHIQKVFDTGKPSKVEFAVETAQGMLYLDLVFSPEFSPNGSVNSVIGISRDVTDRKRAQDEILQLNATLEQHVEERTIELIKANQAKDEFLAMMSHELRTPLNAVLGYSQVLMEGVHGPLSKKQADDIRTIKSSGEHLLGLINDVLDVSKIESGQFALNLENVDVDEVCKSSLVFISQLAEQKSIRVDYSSSWPVPVFVADAKRLKQILVNLLSNAVKFTPNNGTVKLEAQADIGAGTMRFSIMDNGIGISAENISKLFKPFVQLDSSLSRTHQGTGLGLSLVNRLVELHGGRVEVQSEVGMGSCFTFVIPLREALASNEVCPVDSKNEHRESIQLHSVEILLVDDDEVNAMVISDYLEGFGHHVTCASGGKEMFSKLDEIKPDIILMDIQMPNVNGLELSQRLRSDPRFDTVPIIAITALAMPGDRERCLEAGMNDYISKPVSLKKLRNMVEGRFE